MAASLRDWCQGLRVDHDFYIPIDGPLFGAVFRHWRALGFGPEMSVPTRHDDGKDYVGPFSQDQIDALQATSSQDKAANGDSDVPPDSVLTLLSPDGGWDCMIQVDSPLHDVLFRHQVRLGVPASAMQPQKLAEDGNYYVGPVSRLIVEKHLKIADNAPSWVEGAHGRVDSFINHSAYKQQEAADQRETRAQMLRDEAALLRFQRSRKSKP